MKIVELLNNITLPITNEEAEVFDRFGSESVILKADLSPREQLLANSLVNKEVLYRVQENGRISYRKKVR